MLDLIVRGGLVVTPNGTGQFDIGVADGKITAVAVPEAMKGIQAGRKRQYCEAKWRWTAGNSWAKQRAKEFHAKSPT